MHQVWPLRGGRGVCASSALNPRAARRLCSHRAATSDVRVPGPAFLPPPPHTHPHDPPRLTPPLPLRSAALLPGGEPGGCLSSEARTVRGLRLAAAERFGTDNIQSWRETSSVTTALVFTQPRPQPASDVGAGARWAGGSLGQGARRGKGSPGQGAPRETSRLEPATGPRGAVPARGRLLARAPDSLPSGPRGSLDGTVETGPNSREAAPAASLLTHPGPAPRVRTHPCAGGQHYSAHRRCLRSVEKP